MSKGGTMKFLALSYLTLFGYFGDVYSGTVGINSNNNAIKTPLSDAVSPSPPRTPASESVVLKPAPVDTLQPGVCAEDEECGTEDFCSDARGACLPCRRTRKRCGRDAMCCTGSRCSNGVCQANDALDMLADSGTPHRHGNNSMDHHAKRHPAHAGAAGAGAGGGAAGGPAHPVKGQEGDSCLRSTDCSEGFCCARHFWSRICKPVLSEGQVCTRHRRKGAHGLELFQRCDCGDGLACRPERGGVGGAERAVAVAEREREREQAAGHAPVAAAGGGGGRAAGRNLHTCQRR